VTPEEWLKHKSAINKILIGQNIQDPDDKFCMARRVLEGDAFAVFNNAAHYKPMTLEAFNDCSLVFSWGPLYSKALYVQVYEEA
jgi:hypothetical protein